MYRRFDYEYHHALGGTPFIAAYRVRENIIWVLRVLHAARRWPDEP